MSSSIMNYPHSTFYPTLFYFQNFLKIPSYGVAMPTAAALFDYNYFEYKDPQETFDGHLVFSELEIYNYFANNINNFFEQKFNSKFSYYVDYWLLYPPFEDFVGNLNFE
jgi:hypothetical protein